MPNVSSVRNKIISTFYSTDVTQQTILKSPVNSWNEWDSLEEIIVGTPEYSVVPHLLPEVKPCVASAKHNFYIQNGGKYWADVIPKEHWQLLCKQVEDFVKILELEGIKVVRPVPIDHKNSYKILDFETQGFYAAMPRDFLLIVGDEMIEATMTWRSRYFEFLAYRPLTLNYWRHGAKWTIAPKPTNFSKLIKDNPINGDIANESSSYYGKVTTESEPCFDAADFIRAGRDIFAQRSQVTNLSGIEWVRRHLEPRGIKFIDLHLLIQDQCISMQHSLLLSLV
ncbi:Glycine amidinotransferase [Schistosoma japonicum]|uniref:Glycine amidinotransferase n=1 Tax=Schistosoma japonicum TaxID=6182 RepID=A0A4Z2DAZ7_SCHJA|nr:Glycine amidinotransferase [Schistosoma japonicum]TNN13606.1 Glycine amidinotransferase [Schistosoma japonicum]TNN13607.1 Glycine amidinotransferase [Schistosoma japonicum]TNN13608.1 Glycine amidinotransferase [Schistosoma japonicum]